MSLTSSNYAADAYVTAANPAPGRPEVVAYPVRSGSGWDYQYVTQSDGGIGLNVYIAGGTGLGGAVEVTGNLGISLSGASISGSFGGDVNITASIPLAVTSSQASPVWMTGSVHVLNPVTQVTAAFTGVLPVSQTNVPPTQSVLITGGPVGVTGTVGVSGTASVRVESFGAPLEVFGGVAVSGSVTATFTGTVPVSQTNLPATQSVSVQNWPAVQTVTSSQASPVWVTGVALDVNIKNSTISATFASTVGTGALAPPTATMVGFVDPSGNLMPGTVVSGAMVVTGTVHLDNASLTVSQSNLPATQSVFVVNQTSGTVAVSGVGLTSGALDVYVINQGTSSFAGDVRITGSTVTLAVSQTNVPVTQSVFVVNPTSSVSGTVTVTSTIASPVNITGSVYVLNQSSATINISGALDVTSSQANPVWVTGSMSIARPTSGSPAVFAFQSVSASTLLAANPNRVTFSIFNDTDQTYLVCLGSSASVSNFDFSLFPQEYYESPYPSYTGVVTGIGYLSGSGNVRVKEMLP